jgi:hypothetical protein
MREWIQLPYVNHDECSFVGIQENEETFQVKPVQGMKLNFD